MEDFRQAYQPAPAAVLPETERVTVLATPWQRIGAALINSAITTLLYVPLVIGASSLYAEYNSSAPAGNGMLWIGVSMVLLLAWAAYQAVLMSKTGQSLGKKLVGIRVVTLEGANPGFVGTVLMREVVFGLIMGVINIIPLVGPFVYLGVMVALLVMIFLGDNRRRTLQDMLAKTLVVKA